MNKIIFIQPSLPKYRVGFFNELNKLHKVEVHYSTKDFSGVLSHDPTQTEFQRKTLRGFKSIANKLYWQRGVKLAAYSQNDIVVISGNPRVINHMILLILCKLRGVTVIWWGQGWTAGRYGLSAKIRLRLMSIADGVAVYTEHEASRLTHLKNVIGLNNGLDVDEIRSISIDSRPKICTDTQFKTLNILFIGRLTEKSNINLLISSLTLVKRNFHLHIIGDGQLKANLESFIVKNQLSKKVSFHGALYNESEIGKIANLCDCFVYPGAVGLSLIHAFAYGLPAIIHNSRIYHMPEFSAFIDGWNGVSFTRGDKYSLATAIDKLDNQYLSFLKKNAYNTVSLTYNTKDMAIRFSELVKQVSR